MPLCLPKPLCIKLGGLYLEAQNLKKKFKNRLVVNDVSFKLKQGEVVGLLGPNGAGKTTSFYMVIGLIKPDSGVIKIGDQNITTLPMYKRARAGISYLAQEPSIFRKLTVRENIESILEFQNTGQEKIKEKTELLLKQFNLEKVQDQMGYTLSGGERRRGEIARALATRPKFILLDEPFAGVDPIAVNEIKKIIKELKRKKIGVLVTDHNVQATLKITDRAYIVFQGSILTQGSPNMIIKNSRVRKIYLGQDFKL